MRRPANHDVRAAFIKWQIRYVNALTKAVRPGAAESLTALRQSHAVNVVAEKGGTYVRGTLIICE